MRKEKRIGLGNAVIWRWRVQEQGLWTKRGSQERPGWKSLEELLFCDEFGPCNLGSSEQSCLVSLEEE